MNQTDVAIADFGTSPASSAEHLTGTAQTAAISPRRFHLSLGQKQAMESTFLLNARQQLPRLKELLNQVQEHWGVEDGVYWLYVGSYKVYHVQGLTLEICKVLEALMPGRPLNAVFRAIVADGTGRTIDDADDQHWPNNTRPIVEALFHAHYFLKMVRKYAVELDTLPEALPSGWACVLCPFDLR